jgi:Flp pilus assembly protein TadD
VKSPDATSESPSAEARHTEAFREGNALQEVARFTEAIACYDRAISLKPDYMEAHRNRGNALRQLGRLAEAVASYDNAIALRPNVASYTNRGNVLRELKRTEEALQSYEHAIALDPRYAETHNNHGSALQELGRFEDAVASYQRAIALKPDYAQGYNNLGVALTELRRIDEATAAFDEAIALKSDYAEATWNRGLAHLLAGQYASGWRDYEARKQKRDPVGDRSFPKPLWLGDAAVSGKTILVHWEQGFGDTIQFSRYLKLLADAGAKVLFAPQRPLKRLMETLDPRVQIVDIDEPLPEFDFHCPLMSLPLAFGTEPRTIPRIERYLRVDREKANAWRGMLGERTKPFIGVAWSGSTQHKNDRARSIEFRRFMALLDDRYRFISLQKEVSDEDRLSLSRAKIVHLGDALGDFADTAALCSLMDLVISVDTVLAHLAGALGGPVWLLLPYVPDWRWMLETTDTPWYPTMTLIRQRRRGDWDETLRQVRSELASRFGTWSGR